ncbi:MAG: ferrous iron transporter B [Firmicutes bacterium]|nr:ferrous iron transporter B [Bacillota bacterium]
MKRAVLVGFPNVGKSLLFYHLTGNYITVSNYPGTTVEITHAVANLGGQTIEFIDTPGVYSLSPLSEEEAVTCRLLREVSIDCIVHVVDAKNLPRMLPLTLELLQLGSPLVLVLNMMDEADKAGVRIKHKELAAYLGIPVIKASFTQGWGIQAIKKTVAAMATAGKSVRKTGLPSYSQGRQLNLQQQAEQILKNIYDAGRLLDYENWFERFTLMPLGGAFLVVLTLYFGLYLFVGRFGAGTLVDLLEGVLLGEIVLPTLCGWLESFLPLAPLKSLFFGEFGLVTLGFRYAFGIIMPIVGTFFFMFALLEDSGCLPRLAYWADTAMKKIGLNGRAVIPLTLGLGCGTMAVLVTRILESRRERIIATFLLALAVPCSAQLGLIMALLAQDSFYLWCWFGVISVMLLLSSLCLQLLLPGREPYFYLELPPLRRPSLNAIFKKTAARMRWYFREVIPVFLLVSFCLWLLQESGLLSWLSFFMQPLLGQMGLPPTLSTVFLSGFFRRDYGTAGLYDLYRLGLLSGEQLLLAATVLTLFLPCLAQLVMMIRERGFLTAISIAAGVSVIAVVTGIIMRIFLGLPVL